MAMNRLNSLRGAIVAAVAAAYLASGARAAQPDGTIATSSGDAITGAQLQQWVSSLIPGSANGAVFFTECYGGNAAAAFAGDRNVAVGSATTTGQTAMYDGYDWDAADALKPGAGKTAQDVHNAGAAGKAASETPTTGGGLPLGNVSLGPVTEDGAVRSRHILVYAGRPDPKAHRDNEQRDRIKNNNQGAPGTTVTTVGGNGTGGWDYPGTAQGMRSALNRIGGMIAGAPDPSKEQFLIFITDHGGLAQLTSVSAPVIAGGQHTVVDVPSLRTEDLIIGDLIFGGPTIDSPAFAVNITGMTWPVDPDHYLPFFQPGDWHIVITDMANPNHTAALTDFGEAYVEFNDNLVEQAEGEGVTLVFSTDEQTFTSFFDVYYQISIYNHTLGTPRQGTYTVEWVEQTSGVVPKLPEPGTLALLVAGLFAAVRRSGR